jgi:hypothetical protein
MKKKNEESSIEVLITNILLDIDRSLNRKISECKLDLATFNSKEKTLEYIELEKTTIRKSLKETPYKNRTSIDQYLEYLQQNPLDVNLRRKAIENFLYTCMFLYGNDESAQTFFSSFNYRKQGKIEIVKSIVDRATLLEYNAFLNNERNKINEDNFEGLISHNNQLEWLGSKTELVELIKALVETESIKGSQKDIANIIGNLFGINFKNFSQNVQKITGKIAGNETTFIDKLNKNFTTFINKSEQEKRDTSKKRKKNIS